MIKIVSKKYVKADSVERFKTLANELVLKSQLEEGCAFYNLHQAVNDSTILAFIEGWENKEALDKHKVSEHFTRIVPLLENLCTQSGELMVYKEV